jgi:hypothetical protein
MITWLKNLFKNPKAIVKMAVDALDLFVPVLGQEIEKVKGKFNDMTSAQQAQWAIDKVQEFLRAKFSL